MEMNISKRYAFLDKAYAGCYGQKYFGKKPKECICFSWAANKKHKNTCGKSGRTKDGEITVEYKTCKLLIGQDCKEFENGK